MARAAINQELIENYIARLEASLAGIPPSNIFNYDETNLADDPGKKLLISVEAQQVNCSRRISYLRQRTCGLPGPMRVLNQHDTDAAKVDGSMPKRLKTGSNPFFFQQCAI